MDHLNQTVVRQQQQIDVLLREVLALRGQLPDPGAAPLRNPRDEIPPHY